MGVLCNMGSVLCKVEYELHNSADGLCSLGHRQLVDIKLQCLGFAYRFPSVVALSGLLRLVLPVPSPPLPSPSLRL